MSRFALWSTRVIDQQMLPGTAERGQALTRDKELACWLGRVVALAESSQVGLHVGLCIGTLSQFNDWVCAG